MSGAFYELVAAARMAAQLSQSRRKKITLTLRGDGILIEGRFFDEHGVREIGNMKHFLSWPQIETNSPSIATIVDRIGDCGFYTPTKGR